MSQEIEAMNSVLALISILMALPLPAHHPVDSLIPLPALLLNPLKRRLLWNEIDHMGSRSGSLEGPAVRSEVG